MTQHECPNLRTEDSDTRVANGRDEDEDGDSDCDSIFTNGFALAAAAAEAGKQVWRVSDDEGKCLLFFIGTEDEVLAKIHRIQLSSDAE